MPIEAARALTGLSAEQIQQAAKDGRVKKLGRVIAGQIWRIYNESANSIIMPEILISLTGTVIVLASLGILAVWLCIPR